MAILFPPAGRSSSFLEGAAVNAKEDDGPALPMAIGTDDEGNGGIQCRGLFDAGDGRVLIWFASDEQGGATMVRNDDGESVPFVVFWTWDEAAADANGSAGGGWEYRTARTARSRFVREVAKAVGA